MLTNPPGHDRDCWQEAVNEVWVEGRRDWEFSGERPNPIYLRCKHGTLLRFFRDAQWNWFITVVEERVS